MRRQIKTISANVFFLRPFAATQCVHAANVLKTFVLLVFMLVASSSLAATKQFTLVIDAGHGGSDNGAPGAFSNEKDLTLKYALAFGRYVEANCPDIKVIYTRKTDVFVTLAGRADIANRNKADLFLSFHINAVTGSKTAKGFQSWTLGRGERSGDKGIKANLDVAKRENDVIFLEKDYQKTYKKLNDNRPETDIMYEFIADKNREKSVELSRMLQTYVCQATGRNNAGSHQNNLAVLRLSSMPSCLLELGFISTPEEEEFLNNDASVALYVQGIFKAFMKYRQRYDNTISVPFKAIKEEIVVPQVVPADYQPAAPKKRVVKTKAKTPVEAVKKDTSIVQSTPSDQPAADSSTDKPIFKIQILTASQPLKQGDARFKQLQNVDMYQDGNVYKYTYGASTNYNEIYRLRKEIIEKFPDAFIIAFKNGIKTDVNAAIRAFKEHR